MVTALALCSVILSGISLSICLWNIIELKAMQKSTQQFVMVDPSKQDFETLTEELKTKLTNKDFLNLKASEFKM